MPEYLAPGVYVEEVSFRSKSIEGVSTTTTAFIGPTLYGPLTGEPELLTSLLDFERVYGGRGKLEFTDERGWLDPEAADPTAHVGPPEPVDNYLWHAARAFFENGGSRLYVQRVFRPLLVPDDEQRHPDDGEYVETLDPGNGRAFGWITDDLATPADLTGSVVKMSARFPGAAGKRRVRLTVQRGPNVLTTVRQTDPATGLPGNTLVVRGLADRDVVFIRETASGAPAYYWAERITTALGGTTWTFHGESGATKALNGLTGTGAEVRLITLDVTDLPADPDALPVVWSGLPLDPHHERASYPDSVFAKFAEYPANRSDALRLPVVVEAGESLANGADFLRLLLAYDLAVKQQVSGEHDPAKLKVLAALLAQERSSDADRSVEVSLSGGYDGRRPTAAEYQGGIDARDNKTGLVVFEDIEDISILAAPGSTYGANDDAYRSQAATITSLLIGHCERMRYRIAVLDSADGQNLAEVRRMRAGIDSTHAAFYYPWVTVLDPVTQQEIPLPPSGFVCGIYARNDTERAVYKAPANEVVTLAIKFERTINKAQQDVLNPEGINCFRYFPGRGHRLWGARTATSDPEWKYVNLRRYFAYLEHSIDRGTQWAVFEPNGDRLWANVRRTIQDFLFSEWQNGALLGTKPEQAFFVKCDRSTMTQADLDNGRLVCLIGVAPLRPAEFVIFRIGQWTADSPI
ncbi:phage tail sheath subtilisin-like domain-containing protein [Streptomyces sp. NPDC005078]|uniref:phage tail sheath family protein n=1 Tax=unclassified Streptomyces TaxID=2593676 RepID=UPI0033A0180B